MLDTLDNLIKIHKIGWIFLETDQYQSLVLLLSYFKRWLDLLKLGIEIEPQKVLITDLDSPIGIYWWFLRGSLSFLHKCHDVIGDLFPPMLRAYNKITKPFFLPLGNFPVLIRPIKPKFLHSKATILNLLGIDQINVGTISFILQLLSLLLDII